MSECCPVLPCDLQDPASITAAVGRTVSVAEKNGVWIAPTDTIYGFSAPAFHPGAYNRIHQIKDRKENAPFLLLAAETAMVSSFADIPPDLPAVILELFGAGALTLILPFKEKEETVGVRIASDPFSKALFVKINTPLISTSANRSQEPYRDDPEIICETFRQQVDLIIDAGPLGKTEPSTIVDATASPLKMIRAGRNMKEVENAIS